MNKAKTDIGTSGGAGGGGTPLPKTSDALTAQVKAHQHVEVALPPQHDAPHVFRFKCPTCADHMSLYGRMGNWFVKVIG